MKKIIKVILLGHGSSLPYAQKNFEKLTRNISTKFPDHIIDYAFMTEGKAALHNKILSNLTNDIKKIVIVPVFLSHGVHTKEDIPKMLELDSDNKKILNYQGRNIKLIYGEPIGIDNRIIDIVEDRIQAAIKLKVI
ncbi:MAG: CbiX/SirB N-terminal domain-containing protein [Candidatus Helarchaeota archaeon]